MDLRHEWKHRINVEDLILLRQRLRLLAKPDPYAVGGCYHIRSLYFDTPSDKALREKLDGVNGREKFRIRCYNRDFSLIHLEKKSKRNGLGRKEKVRLTPDQVQALMNGETNWMMASGNPLQDEVTRAASPYFSGLYSGALRLWPWQCPGDSGPSTTHRTAMCGFFKSRVYYHSRPGCHRHSGGQMGRVSPRRDSGCCADSPPSGRGIF